MPVGRPKAIRPIDEGSMKKIWDTFVKPILANSGTMEQNLFLEAIFRVGKTDISHWIATRGFNIPGLYYAAACVKIQGMGYSKISEGDQLLARIDEASPTIDVEFMGGQGQKDQVYCLEPLEWEWTKQFLRPANSTDKSAFRELKRLDKRRKYKKDLYK